MKDFFVPDGMELESAVGRTTHLGIGAHQDDLEFMAFHGIVECRYADDRWFGGIICTDGAGSSRRGPYAEVADAELCRMRVREQRAAAEIGRFSFMAQLGHSSKSLGRAAESALVGELRDLIGRARPEVIYTHNPADKHVTHLRVLVAVLAALRELPEAERPRRLLGCEMWRGLDWVNDDEKVVMDVSGHEHLAAALNGVFDSQIAGGKRYDLAVAGRRRANATLLDAGRGDGMAEAAYALDLTPMIGAEPAEVVDFALAGVDRFRADVAAKLRQALEGV